MVTCFRAAGAGRGRGAIPPPIPVPGGANFAPPATALLTWNAKHFRGRLGLPVLTPDEWLNQQPPAGPTP